MSESSFFRQFQKIINFFVSYAPKIIKFPSTAEGKEHLADEFKKVKMIVVLSPQLVLLYNRIHRQLTSQM